MAKKIVAAMQQLLRASFDVSSPCPRPPFGAGGRLRELLEARQEGLRVECGKEIVNLLATFKRVCCFNMARKFKEG